MQSHATPKKIKSIADYLKPKVLLEVKEHLTTLAGVRGRWKFIEERNQEFSEKRVRLETEIKELMERGVVMAQSGGDPLELSQPIHDKQVELEDCDRWIKEINAKIEALRPEMNAAENTLNNALQNEVRKIWPKYLEEFNGYLEAASELDSSFFRAVQKVVSEIRGNTDWSVSWGASQISFPMRIDTNRSNFRKMGR